MKTNILVDHISLSSSKNKKVTDKRYRENQNTFMVSIFFFENRAAYEMMWKNTI
jgi:hypothetical protein